MRKTPPDLKPSRPLQGRYSDESFERRRRLGAYFRSARLSASQSEVSIADALELPSSEMLMAYESGRLAMPLEDVCTLTNLLNLAPEDVMDLIHGLYAQLGTD